MSLNFSNDGKQLATAGMDGLVKLWDISGEAPVEKKTLEGPSEIVVRNPAASLHASTLCSCVSPAAARGRPLVITAVRACAVGLLAPARPGVSRGRRRERLHGVDVERRDGRLHECVQRPFGPRYGWRLHAQRCAAAHLRCKDRLQARE